MAPVLNFGLPIPLLQLVHLHLLEYPLANNAEYDQNLFNPTVRGLRDRTKSLEDVSFFLVTKIESAGGRKESAKSILSTYPCTAPADTMAFRTSLAKYLENLRHAAVYPKSGVKNPGASLVRDKGKTKELVTSTETAESWWWKDVVVRKSLLEECSGGRFERLLLSLSTHALSVSSPLSLSSLGPDLNNIDTAAAILSKKYTSLLISYQLAQKSWERSAFFLMRREDDLKSLRDHLTLQSETSSSKYSALSPVKLVALAGSRLEDLLQELWRGQDGRQALERLVQLAGLQSDSGDARSDFRQPIASDSIDVPQKATSAPFQPLPIAAAHHPSSLRKLRTSVFTLSKKSPLAESNNKNANFIYPNNDSEGFGVLSTNDSPDAENKIQGALQEALANTQMIRDDLQVQLTSMKDVRKYRESHDSRDVVSSLWVDEQAELNVNFHMVPDPDRFFSLTSYIAPSADTLKSRTNHIREVILPSYPSIFKPPADLPRHHSRLPQQSAIPRTLAEKRLEHPPHISSTTHTFIKSDAREMSPLPATPRRLITSTPPTSVKPRSAFARKTLASHSNSKIKVEFNVCGSSGLRKSRKSVKRMSFAVARRPSLFGSESPSDGDQLEWNGDDDGYDDVNQIIGAVHDESKSFEAYVTPKLTRIATPHKSVSPFKKKNGTPGPRLSFKIVERSSLAPLPDVTDSSENLLHSIDQIQETGSPGDDWTDEEGGDIYEGKSITLRDILLQAAETTQFDLLDGPDLSDQSMTWE